MNFFPRITLLAAAIALVLYAAPAEAQNLRLLRDAEIENDLKVISTPVFEEAGLSPSNIRFILVDNSVLNAFVAGGQNIFIHTGLILETANPGELLGVIAHETGHISGGHLFRTQEAIEDISMQAMLANLLGLAVALGAKSGDAAMALGTAGSTYAMRTILRHSRVQETAADQAAVRFLKDSRLPLSGFHSFMQKLADQELLPESQQSEYVRTHPLSRDRVDFIANVVANEKNNYATPAVWTKLHSRMKAKITGFLFPDRALQDRGDSADSRYGRAIALYRKGKTDESMALLNPLIAEEPQNAYLHELKGQILFESGRVAQSLEPYAKSLSLAPRAGLIRAAYGHALLEAGKTADALRELKKSLDTEPKEPKTYRMMATAYGKMGQEGMSRLSLAEEALLRGKFDNAKVEANLAKKSLEKNSSGYLRVQDILNVIKRREERKKR